MFFLLKRYSVIANLSHQEMRSSDIEARKQELLDLKLTELKGHCEKRKLKKSKDTLYDIYIDKPDLVERIINYDLNVDKIPSNKKKIDIFLQSIKRCVAEEMPLINQHYYETFAAVDRYVQHLGYAPYLHKIRSKNMLILINCLLMVVNNSRAIYLEIAQQGLVEDTQETFKHYLLSLANSLLEQ